MDALFVETFLRAIHYGGVGTTHGCWKSRRCGRACQYVGGFSSEHHGWPLDEFFPRVYHRYFLDNLPDDNVPPSDFDAPLDEYNLKDSSSTAIVASAMLELFWTLRKSLAPRCFHAFVELQYFSTCFRFVSSRLVSPLAHIPGCSRVLRYHHHGTPPSIFLSRGARRSVARAPGPSR